MTLMEKALLKLSGYHRYRVRVEYKDARGSIVISYNTTVGVANRKYIDNGRCIKKELGPIYHVNGIDRSWLCNGKMYVEPICYLGRWK